MFAGQVIPNYSSRADYDKMFGLGVSMYGQMTAGSYCYIGPQGIVHGTTLTILNAGRTKLGSSDLAGKVFFTSGRVIHCHWSRLLEILRSYWLSPIMVPRSIMA